MSQSVTKEFKKKYNHCKVRVKQWEQKFSEEHGRKPNKTDIKEADPKIKQYYKMYWKLKSTLLEETILGSSFDDEVDCFEDLDCTLKERNIDEPIVNNDVNVIPIVEKNVDSVPTKNNENAVKSIKKPEPKKWMKSVSSKLFEGSSFKTRNPRKALTKKSQSQNTSNLNLTDASFSQSFVSDVSFQSCLSPLPPETEVNETSFSAENEISPKIKSLIESEAALSPLFASLGKVKIVTNANQSAPHPLSSLSQVGKSLTARKLDLGWVERCTQVADTQLIEGRTSLDSGFESTSGSISSPSTDTIPLINESATFIQESSDEDDLICDSDDESSQHFISLKRKASKLDISQNLEPENTSENTKKLKLEDSVVKIEEVSKISLKKKLEIEPEPKLSQADQIKRDILESKMKAGTMNDNFVKINIKKKVFVRGKRNFNHSKYKKSEWKKKKKELNSGGEIGGVLRCFKCGDVGHYARNCAAMKEDKLIPVDESWNDDPGLPSIQEAEEMAREAALKFTSRNSLLSQPLPQPSAIPDDLPELEGVPQAPRDTSVAPLSISRNELLFTLRQFGHSAFRPGQEEAVMRVLSGKSTLLMLSTGGGKSLCYQLPAYLYHKERQSTALVISPLVSLMDDQVAGSLSFLKIGCLHANQTEKQRANVIAQLEAGTLVALLVSPEAVVSCDNLGFGSVLKKLPSISFACIDEVHCVSQWSYNFRPSYLMLTKVLRERLNVKTILGLTATGSKSTVASIIKELHITDDDGVIQDTPVPSYINLTISRVAEKDDALLQLIQKSGGGAILVYCTRREECVRLATLIRTALRGVTAEAYHAGLVASKRKSVQKSFMSGKVQVVVATVAFGMGINKQDIRCVFHYNMPKNWESYVQEVGRAGRDGQPANCHLLLQPKGSDLLELRRHIYGNSVDRHVIRKLLQRIFHPCNCEKGCCAGHEVAFSAAESVTALDLPEENIATLLCYLELHQDNLVKTLPQAYMTCKLQSYHGPRGIHRAARECPPLAVAAIQDEEGVRAASMSFNVIELARKVNWDSGTVKRHLKQTEWRRNEKGSWCRSGINVSFCDLGIRVRSRGDLTPEQLDEALNYLMNRVEQQQKTALSLLQSVYSTFHYFASDFKTGEVGGRSEEIKEAIRTYFKTETLPEGIPQLTLQEEDFDENVIAADVRHLVLNYKDNTFNGRAVARIFHGMQSPNYPASVWFRARQWRAHLDKPFERLQQIATREILKLK